MRVFDCPCFGGEMSRSDKGVACVSKGFTLIEVLVALVLVSIMSLMAWRAIDGLGRAGELTNSNEQVLQRTQIGLAQWTADLDAITDVGIVGTGAIAPLEFDGQRLRLTRQSSQPGAGVVVVAWALRSTETGRVLQRWASTPITDRRALQTAWLAAERWARTPLPEDAKFAVTLMPVSQWQIFYYRDGAWSNPQSAAGATSVPDGVQLILDVPNGKLTKFWAAPILGATK
jgi:general secretion pathway protein J